MTATSVFLGTMLPATPGPKAASRFEAAPSSPVARYADGAPRGFSSGSGEQSCHACHFQAEVNTQPGSVTIAGMPERFVAGKRYPLTVTLTRPGMIIGGFQLTARFEDGGAQAGVLTPAPGEEERVAIEASGDVQYANQRRPGTALVAPDTARWTLLWTAPEATATVRFHVAANAADDDESVYGDYIYTAVLEAGP